MDTPPSSRIFLRRLAFLIFLAAVLVIFAYGWTVTDIDLSVPQEPQRQQNVANALQELLSPNVFTQDYDIQTATTSFVMNCAEGFTAPEVVTSEGLYIAVEPGCGASDETVTVRGYNFPNNALARVNWIATDGERRIRQVVGTKEDNFITNEDGTFSVQIQIPRIRGTAGEMHTIEVQGRIPKGAPRISDATYLVLEKMTETIFLALIATAVSILPAAVLSFFAAHNLMRPVRTQLGSMLLSFILLPVGWWIGTLILGQIGTLALDIGKGGAAGSAASAALMVGMVASARKLHDTDESIYSARMRSVLNVLLAVVVAAAAIGLIGGLGLLFDRVVDAPDTDLVTYLATFIGSLGSMVELMIVPFSGVLGAFAMSSVGATLTRDLFKQITVPMSHIVGSGLGAVAGAILLGLMAMIAMSAAWLGLLTPVIAAGLAASILPQVYRRVAAPYKPVESILSWVGTILGFIATFLIMNVQQAVVEDALPPQTVAFTIAGLTVYSYVLKAMLIGAVLGGVSGALSGTRANFAIGSVLYSITRTILNLLRSIEPLIMGLVFVIWVGIGPFAGVLALALHSIASLGKLYSEQIENIDAGPIEALQSTGANRLQTIMYAVVPQIIPPYIAFTMYRWDINVRMSTIIGFVGGGGIGFLLQQQINLLRYRDAGVAVLAIAIVVSILDYASAAIRERYI